MARLSPSIILSSIMFVSCVHAISFAGTIPKVNQYNVTLRAVAPEPSAAQFSISAQDQVKVSKPLYGYHTQLNLLDRAAIYSIPAYVNVNKIPKISKRMNFKLINNLPVYAVPQSLRTAKNAKVSYVPAHWLNVKVRMISILSSRLIMHLWFMRKLLMKQQKNYLKQ